VLRRVLVGLKQRPRIPSGTFQIGTLSGSTQRIWWRTLSKQKPIWVRSREVIQPAIGHRERRSVCRRRTLPQDTEIPWGETIGADLCANWNFCWGCFLTSNMPRRKIQGFASSLGVHREHLAFACFWPLDQVVQELPDSASRHTSKLLKNKHQDWHSDCPNSAVSALPRRRV
jgi:hypothetical protein